ncbi:sulfotransferase [Caulobacter sp. NIBR1757]|uniref:sulfotransferase n=1 Tax=Caulobacter sp. NIBR1757 TaxID=3016000 RepID=UPI0022F06D5F|nr:sulfotransferase [Caulobacter sp. NIBR1757]WGM40041.1 hypothetical protein AMEJIAPC_02982 [Caulobacter sp. NIBR1757]
MSALPNLVIIGAMKCGTTSLHQYLDVHPDIGMSDPKEVNFFSGEASDRPLDWYKSLFDPSKAVRGEASQSYSKAHLPIYAGAPERMAEIIPDAKLIYLVRDPIKRYSSHLLDNIYNEHRSTVSWALETDHYIKTGSYHFQLSFFLKHYSMDQIMVVDLEDLKAHRLDTMNKIVDFLGVKPFEDGSAFDFVANVATEKLVPHRWKYSRLARLGQRIAPGLTDQILDSRLLRETLLPHGKKAILSDEDKARLAERFRPDVDALRTLLGRDFKTWSV